MTSLLLFSYAVLGFIAHIGRRVTTDHMTANWRELSNYGLGVLYVFPLASFLFDQLEADIPNHRLRFKIAYLLSFVSFGVGVLAGHRYSNGK
jgi:hypothetical protein